MPTKNIVVVASFKAQKGKEEMALAELSALLSPTRKEDGCVQYDLHCSADDPGCLVFYEIWESRSALDEHLQQPYLQALLGMVDKLFAEAPDIQFLQKLG